MEILFDAIHEKDLYNCFEYGVINILMNYKKNYEFVLKNSMLLDLRKNAFDGDVVINNRRFAFKNTLFAMSKDLFGIKFTWITIDNTVNVLEYIECELLRNHPVLINMDLFYDNSRSDYYKKVHSKNHCRIVTGITEDSVVVYNWNERYLMPKQDFVNGACEMIIHEVSDGLTQLQSNQTFERIKHSLQCIITDYTAREWIKTLRIWERDLEQFDFYKIYQSGSTLLQNPVFNDIRTLARSRERYILFMKKEASALENDCDKENCNKIINNISLIVYRYQLMKMTLLREEAYYIENKHRSRSEIVRKKLKRQLQEAIDLEEGFIREVETIVKQWNSIK